MQLSKVVFRFLLVIVTFLALLTLFLLPFQQPGTGRFVVTVFTLAIQITFIVFLVAALYFDWNPLPEIEEIQ